VSILAEKPSMLGRGAERTRQRHAADRLPHLRPASAPSRQCPAASAASANLILHLGDDGEAGLEREHRLVDDHLRNSLNGRLEQGVEQFLDHRDHPRIGGSRRSATPSAAPSFEFDVDPVLALHLLDRPYRASAAGRRRLVSAALIDAPWKPMTWLITSLRLPLSWKRGRYGLEASPPVANFIEWRAARAQVIGPVGVAQRLAGLVLHQQPDCRPRWR
jgi:hypothetical protein